MVDAIIIGGGPAGLSAALALGRCRRKVVIFDKGEPRNAASKALHGFLTRDGIEPMEFLRIGREEIRRYPSIEFIPQEIVSVERKVCHFVVHSEDGNTFLCRILLLATGIIDLLPDWEGMERFYGRSVHHCPYCDGWEHRDQTIAVFGQGQDGVDLAMKMHRWSSDIVLCVSGDSIDSAHLKNLAPAGIRLKFGEIERLEGEGTTLRRILFRDGSELDCSALFFSPSQQQRSGLAFNLGCRVTKNGQLDCDENQQTSIPGVYAIGNASRGLQLVIIAAAEGTRAGFAIDEALDEADKPASP